jgi:type II secretory pathway pseudopilin PulG
MNKSYSPQRYTSGFSLIETLIYAALVSVILGVLFSTAYYIIDSGSRD